MKLRFLITTLLAATAIAAERWTSPDKFYSMTPPSGWNYREDASGGHRSFAWTSPDEKAEIRISATYNLVRLQKDLPDLILEAFFPDERGTTPMQKVNGLAGMVCSASTSMQMTALAGLASQHAGTSL